MFEIRRREAEKRRFHESNMRESIREILKAKFQYHIIEKSKVKLFTIDCRIIDILKQRNISIYRHSDILRPASK